MEGWQEMLRLGRKGDTSTIIHLDIERVHLRGSIQYDWKAGGSRCSTGKTHRPSPTRSTEHPSPCGHSLDLVTNLTVLQLSYTGLVEEEVSGPQNRNRKRVGGAWTGNWKEALALTDAPRRPSLPGRTRGNMFQPDPESIFLVYT